MNYSSPRKILCRYQLYEVKSFDIYSMSPLKAITVGNIALIKVKYLLMLNVDFSSVLNVL